LRFQFFCNKNKKNTLFDRNTSFQILLFNQKVFFLFFEHQKKKNNHVLFDSFRGTGTFQRASRGEWLPFIRALTREALRAIHLRATAQWLAILQRFSSTFQKELHFFP
jgi:hypothetical protein